MNRASLVRSNDGSPVLEGQYADVDSCHQPVLCLPVDMDGDVYRAVRLLGRDRADESMCPVHRARRLHRMGGLHCRRFDHHDEVVQVHAAGWVLHWRLREPHGA